MNMIACQVKTSVKQADNSNEWIERMVVELSWENDIQRSIGKFLLVSY